MNIFDSQPDIPPCPHCGCSDPEALNWAFPDALEQTPGRFPVVQVACLACGAHTPPRPSYAEAIAAFVAGEKMAHAWDNYRLPSFSSPAWWAGKPMNTVRLATIRANGQTASGITLGNE